MPSDIVLENDSIRFEGPTFDLHGHTLVLDNVLARDDLLNRDELRRPLVHDGGDSLTINWHQKYTGGVTIFGHVSVPDTLLIKGNMRVNLAKIPEMLHLPPLAPPSPDGMVRPDGRPPTVPAAGPDPGAPVIPGHADPFSALASASPREVELMDEIQMVRTLLRNLNDRLKALEAR